MEDIKIPCDEQATFIQLNARLEVLENKKREMSEILDQQQAEYKNVCKQLEDMCENVYEDVYQFVRRDTIYFEARKKRQLTINKALSQLQIEQKQVDYELIQWRNKEKLVLAEQSKMKIVEQEIEQLHQRMEELKSELKTRKENKEKLEKEKEIVDEYPIRDIAFLTLKETLLAARESERINEQAFKSLGGHR